MLCWELHVLLTYHFLDFLPPSWGLQSLSPLLHTLAKHMLLCLWISPLFLIFTAKRPQWKKSFIRDMVLFSFYPLCQESGRLSLTVYISIPSSSSLTSAYIYIPYIFIRYISPTLLIWGSQVGWSPVAESSYSVIQNNNRCFSHTLVASPFSLYRVCCFFQTRRFKLWQLMFCYDSWHGHTSLTFCALKQTEPRLILRSTWMQLLTLLPPMGR